MVSEGDDGRSTHRGRPEMGASDWGRCRGQLSRARGGGKGVQLKVEGGGSQKRSHPGAGGEGTSPRCGGP